jgi:hypothetical protein
VKVCDGPGQLGDKACSLARSRPPLVGISNQRENVNVIHDDERLAFMEIDVNDPQQVRMVAKRQPLTLTAQPISLGWCIERSCAIELEDQLFSELRLANPEDIRLMPQSSRPDHEILADAPWRHAAFDQIRRQRRGRGRSVFGRVCSRVGQGRGPAL